MNLEREKEQLEIKVQQSNANNSNMESPMHKDMQLPNLAKGGSVMSTFLAASKFSGKVYAQKTMKSMIEERESAMDNIYTNNQINKMSDTRDLVTYMSQKTQYDEEDYKLDLESQ